MGKYILLKREWSYGTIIRTTGGVSGTLETVYSPGSHPILNMFSLPLISFKI